MERTSDSTLPLRIEEIIKNFLSRHVRLTSDITNFGQFEFFLYSRFLMMMYYIENNPNESLCVQAIS